MKTNALAPWYGSNRTNAHRPAEFLRGIDWLVVGFAGGMSELKYLRARTILVNDRHRHVINLARVVRDQHDVLKDMLQKCSFHPDELAESQEFCKNAEVIGGAMAIGDNSLFGVPVIVNEMEWAYHYFVCAWMARNGTAGTKDEFDQSMSLRYTATGGDSAVRFRSATESLAEWSRLMRNWTFTTDEVFEMLQKCHDKPGHGGYFDAPWPGDGDAYKHGGGDFDHARLAADLESLRSMKVVVRYGDCELVRALYPEDKWKWHLLDGRTQANKAKAEVLLTRNI